MDKDESVINSVIFNDTQININKELKKNNLELTNNLEELINKNESINLLLEQTNEDFEQAQLKLLMFNTKIEQLKNIVYKLTEQYNKTEKILDENTKNKKENDSIIEHLENKHKQLKIKSSSLENQYIIELNELNILNNTLKKICINIKL